MSGLKPFNKMHPNDAKRIQRLGCIARAKQRALTEENVHYINSVARYYENEYDGVNAIQRIALDIYKQIYSYDTPVNEKINLFKFIQNELMKHNKYTDEYNSLLYKTWDKKYQIADCYTEGFSDNKDIDSINNDTNTSYENLTKEYEREKHPERYNDDEDDDPYDIPNQTTDNTSATKSHSDTN